MADDPTADVSIVHLTDTHLTAGELLHGTTDTLIQLRQITQVIADTGRNVDVLLVTGDATQDGDAAAYDALTRTLSPLALELGAELVHVPGNHDDVAAYAEAVRQPGGSFDRVVEVAGLRIVTLDTTREGRHDGLIDDSQASWLAAALEAPPPCGTIIAMHHSPLRSALPVLDALRLKESGAFAEIVSQACGVRMILAGHSHVTGTGLFAGVPVWLGTPASYSVDAWSKVTEQVGRGVYGFSRIDLIGEQTIATSVVVGDQPVVYRNAAADFEPLLADYR